MNMDMLLETKLDLFAKDMLKLKEYVARMEAIRMILAYAFFKRVKVYRWI